ncbi:zinc finger, RING-type domain-containing protein [Endozoicomonas sp. 4G]|uniref:RING finger protein n=1 Tax=Endozoicomonas sp. 4G TaxID=2872754 RepID=UPI002078D3A1|nr:zinc finger, RING-type domain-containing protein [Endozoicomonas sp. 4G]
MKRFLRSLFLSLSFIASVEAQITDELTAHPLPDQASTLPRNATVSSADSESDKTSEKTSAPSQEGAQGTSEGQESAEDDPQQLLNQYLAGFDIMPTPADNFCWLHAIHLSAGQDVSGLIRTLIEMINHRLPDNEQAVATEHSDFLSQWIAAQGEENVRLIKRQLRNKEWPDFSILLPLLSHLFKKTFVVINLQASGLTQDQVFTYATSQSVEVSIVSAASAINTSEETIYLGLLSRDSHFVGIQPETRGGQDSHKCPVCLEPFTKNSGIKSTDCFHYLCDECFKKLNKPAVWDCPVCRKPQLYIEPEDKDQQPSYLDESDTKVPSQTYLPNVQKIYMDLDPFHALQTISQYCATLALPGIRQEPNSDDEIYPELVVDLAEANFNFSTGHTSNLKKHKKHRKLHLLPSRKPKVKRIASHKKKKGDKKRSVAEPASKNR